jgi:hypothetical protein
MKLTELDASLLKIESPTSHRIVKTVPEADGVCFQCPVCFAVNKGPEGVHYILCWRPQVPLTVNPGPGRWEFKGNTIADLSLDNSPGASSVLIQPPGCSAHFHIRNGEIV